LLECDELEKLINYLKANYDDVLIDTPPIHLVTDALIIARVADASLYIIRQGYTDKSELDFLNEINGQERFPQMHIIFNGIQKEKYGYGYNYDTSYYTVKKQRKSLSSMLSGISDRF